ncbi:MAG: pantoate--beta-alanine ligase [Acidimicrobiia bacterium]
MITCSTIAEVRAVCDSARLDGRRVGFVPTMGCFHDGHRSLMRVARAANDLVVVSIFVNPLQFGPTEDLAAYPRDLARDTEVVEAERIDVLFAPTVDEMYPEPTRTVVHVEGLTDGLCGAARPTHFDGVTTVVAKLFSIVGPCRAYFGRKDFQQLAVVRRMTTDLNLPIDVVGCPLVREIDGVAMSSRNAYLSEAERSAATVLSKAVFWASETIVRGERDPEAVVASVHQVLALEPTVEPEYAEVRAAATLTPVEVLDGEVVVALAARVGGARLIDNCALSITGDAVEVDLGVLVRPGT